jgi:hypothetical protein
VTRADRGPNPIGISAGGTANDDGRAMTPS